MNRVRRWCTLHNDHLRFGGAFTSNVASATSRRNTTTTAAAAAVAAVAVGSCSRSGMFRSTPLLRFSLVDQPLDGGPPVPIYSKYNGRIVKRNWVFRNPNWCSLCKEPIAMWVNHIGRKDHSLLDHVYSVLVDFPRNWDPEVLLVSYSDFFGGKVQLESLQRKYGLHDAKRRTELLSMLMWLGDRGIVNFGDPRHNYLTRMNGGVMGMNTQAEMALRRYLMGPLLRLFPHGEIQNFSNFIDFVVCGYNLETVYDLNGFSTLDALSGGKHVATSPAASGLGGLATGLAPETTGYVKDAGSSGDGKDRGGKGARGITEQEAQEAFSRKAAFVRSVLGQLRWAATDWKIHPQGKPYPDHIVTVTELCCRYLVAEALTCRLCEYAVRTEPMWREHGMERVKLDVGKAFRSGISPPGLREGRTATTAPASSGGQSPTATSNSGTPYNTSGSSYEDDEITLAPEMERWGYRAMAPFAHDMYEPKQSKPSEPPQPK